MKENSNNIIVNYYFVLRIECHCGSNYLAGRVVDESQCTMPCSGNSSQICGDTFRVNIYEITSNLHIFLIYSTVCLTKIIIF